ncbi:hypothetical protein JJV70_00065 [Streptomyces sp. JJ66]|uniref:hypothetical protein n=1 Tax=Streptomyces sp. JJ66 TaxID=2803843 RepID=UPI001C58B923|nr:hypothetical protein [Streptomyces sp. JJ66]MBW1600520.1 hypothetical protein [Streptomyces sp. JJ66]
MSETVRAGSDQAQQEASATAGRAGQAAGRVADTAGEQARAVTGQAREQGMAAARDLRDRARSEADTQTHRTADTIRHWADDMAAMAGRAEQDTAARRLVTQLADGGRRAADHLDERGVDGLLQEVQGFARRRPAAFLGAAALAGVVAGRLAKAGSAANGDGGHGDTPGSAAPAAGGASAAPDAAGGTGTETETTWPQAGQARTPGSTGWPSSSAPPSERDDPRPEV